MTTVLGLVIAPSSLWVKLAIVGAWLGLVGLTSDWLYRHQLATPEVVRKVVHIGAGNVILLAWWLDIPTWIGVTASIGFSILAFLSYHMPILPSLNGVGRKSLGTFFYAVSVGLLIGLFWPMGQPVYAVIGILTMAWGDGLAAIVGQRWGRHPYYLWTIKKSWEGSIAMAIISGLVCYCVLLGTIGNSWEIWAISGITALVAASLEAFSYYGIDNLTVPLGSAVLCFGLVRLLFLA